MADLTLPGLSNILPEDLAASAVQQQKLAHLPLEQMANTPELKDYFNNLMERRAQNLSVPEPPPFNPPARPSFLEPISKAAPYVENEVVKDIALPTAENAAKKAALMKILSTGGQLAGKASKAIPYVGALLPLLESTEAGANSDKPIGPQGNW